MVEDIIKKLQMEFKEYADKNGEDCLNLLHEVRERR